MAEDVLDGLIVVLRLKGGPSSDQLVDRDGSRPNVDLLVVAASTEHLWGPVEESSRDGEHVDPAGPPLELPADAEVDELYLFGDRIIENIFRLDVPMSNRTLVHVLNGFQQLLNDFSELTFRGDGGPK